MTKSGPVRRTLWGAVALLAPALMPAAARADSDVTYDARMEGYENRQVAYERSGVGSQYLYLIFLTLVGAGVMFKSAKRSHLD